MVLDEEDRQVVLVADLFDVFCQLLGLLGICLLYTSDAADESLPV